MTVGDPLSPDTPALAFKSDFLATRDNFTQQLPDISRVSVTAAGQAGDGQRVTLRGSDRAA
jgi:hypothetical protein